MSTLPFWLAEALAAEQPAPPTPLVGSHEVDVCIVGGGFTGLWSAIALKQAEPHLRILVLEKDRCGSGPNGIYIDEDDWKYIRRHDEVKPDALTAVEERELDEV